MPRRGLIVVALLAAVVAALAWLLPERQSAPPRQGYQSVTDALGGNNTEGYARATHPREFSFPADHGAHPDFRNEWWYFTGNLSTADGRRFGYQLVIFRIALQPEPPEHVSRWAGNQIYMGHLALTDPLQEQHLHEERFARAAIGLAGAQAQPFRVWLENWSVTETSGNRWELQARTDRFNLQLELQSLKPVMLQGDGGLSRKSAEPGNASYYYSLTRLATQGTLTLDGTSHDVQGLSWLDREWSTSALADDQAGWDWFSLQLDSGDDLMFYQLRRKDGSIDPLSAGTLVDAGGRATSLHPDGVVIETLDNWQSPAGVRYPSRWRLRIPAHGFDLTITPLMAGQELDVSVRYWEGAVAVEGKRDGDGIRGHGYVELTGYR
jgi:predicted secreted hydrolase